MSVLAQCSSCTAGANAGREGAHLPQTATKELQEHQGAQTGQVKSEYCSVRLLC